MSKKYNFAYISIVDFTHGFYIGVPGVNVNFSSRITVKTLSISGLKMMPRITDIMQKNDQTQRALQAQRRHLFLLEDIFLFVGDAFCL
jgi:hypothetical protein